MKHRRYGRGDSGETDLLGGVRVWKDDERVEAYGAVDEVNSLIGLARSLLPSGGEVSTLLQKLQEHLFIIGSELASLGTSAQGRFRVGEEVLDLVEKAVAEYEAKLPELKGFLYPGGSPAAAALHVARSVARRAERRLVALTRRFEVNPISLAYLNRLSTLLFLLARYVNLREGVEERVWGRP